MPDPCYENLLNSPRDEEINKYIKHVDELDERVGDLEAIVRELEEWTGELGRVMASPMLDNIC